MQTDDLKQIVHYNTRKARPDSGKCALLVIDMQNYFSAIAASIIGNVRSVIGACRSCNMPVVFTQHGHENEPGDLGMLGEWWGDFIQYGSKDWELIRAVQPLENESTIEKNRYNAFHGTELDDSLKTAGVQELIITGVLTNCCCETTARDAFVRDYRVFFVADATNTVSRELHLATLKNLAFGFAHILSTEQLCGYLGS
jgi:isochorismate hydrolase